MIFLTASLAFGVSIFMMLYMGMTSYTQRQIFLRRVEEYSRVDKKNLVMMTIILIRERGIAPERVFENLF